MTYLALLRGINVGGNNKINMKELKTLFESLGYIEIQTYLNTGNVIFQTNEEVGLIQEKIATTIKTELGLKIPVLVKSQIEIKRIADKIPKSWTNDKIQKTDIAYLFPGIDSEQIISQLPIQKEYIDVRYTKGAIYWNVKRDNQTKSWIEKLASHKFYKLMTVRNVNTVRKLYNLMLTSSN